SLNGGYAIPVLDHLNMVTSVEAKFNPHHIVVFKSAVKKETTMQPALPRFRFNDMNCCGPENTRQGVADLHNRRAGRKPLFGGGLQHLHRYRSRGNPKRNANSMLVPYVLDQLI